MRFRYSNRVYFVAIIIVLFSIYANGKLLLKTLKDVNLAEMDNITKFEKRFAELKKHLPRNGTFCYVNDSNLKLFRSATDRLVDNDYYVGLDSYSEEELYKKYHQKRWISQYVLAPIVLTFDLELPYIIGDFRDYEISTLKNLLSQRGYYKVDDFGNGVLLITKG